MEWDITCIILAGGRSRRMGRDKAFIQVAGVRLFDYVYSRCRSFFSEVVVVTNWPRQFQGYHALIVADEVQGAGSLGGLYTGLLWAKHYYAFCVACDMPFLRPEVIAHLVAKKNNYDVVIPKTKEGLEPLHALYSKKCIEPIKTLLDSGRFKITEFLPKVRVRYCEEEEIRMLDPSLSSFININTKKDLLKVQELLKGAEWEETLKAY